MRKPGTNELNVQMSDVICDFCHHEWTDARPMVEGHQGSCICGSCLTVAYTELALLNEAPAPAGYTCRLCLEQRDDPGWPSPVDETAVICRRCAKQSAGVLHKSKDYDWTKPRVPTSDDETA